MKNLLIRSISGTVYVIILLGALFWNKNAFSFVCLFFTLLGLYEFQKLTIKTRLVNLTLVFAFIVFVLFHLVFIEVIDLKWLSLSVFMPFIIYSSELFRKDNNILVNLTINITGLLYVLLPLIILNYLNLKSENKFSELILVAFILVWVNDSFAYLAGIAFGKHKLFERISPKKTWEGFTGGVFATIIAAYFLKGYLNIENLILWEFFALIIAIAAVFGDFIESWFKRTAGVKDSGKIMPGHGGILDRIDSLLFVIPVVFIYFEITK